MASKAFKCWVVRLKDDEGGFLAHTTAAFLSFNTWKFTSYASAVAWCRQQNINPVDYEICLAEFRQPKIVERRDIDYSTSTLAVAVEESAK